MREDGHTEIRVITPITAPAFRSAGDFEALKRPGLKITLDCIKAGPASIECAFDAAIAAPDTARCVLKAQADGVDAVVIDCMADPGLTAARECVTIPVLGPAQTAMHLAAMLGRHFSVLTVLTSMRTTVEQLAAVYGLTGKLASVRPINIAVLDIENDGDRTLDALADAALQAVRSDGADSIVFGCTGLLGYADAVRLRLAKAGHDVSVIDPVPATIRIADALVSANLRHSKIAYPRPASKAIAGYPEFGLDFGAAAE